MILPVRIPGRNHRPAWGTKHKDENMAIRKYQRNPGRNHRPNMYRGMNQWRAKTAYSVGNVRLAQHVRATLKTGQYVAETWTERQNMETGQHISKIKVDRAHAVVFADGRCGHCAHGLAQHVHGVASSGDRKSTRLNSSHRL